MNELVRQMIDWIEDNLKNPFSLDKLSNCMGYSPYYCSFKFHQVTGISMRRYVLLRRLYLSIGDLKKDKRIIDIAIEYGYSSQEAYSRAFKAVFGIAPREYQLSRLPVQSFVKLTTNKDEEWCEMNLSRKIEIEKLQSDKRELFDMDVLNILNGQVMYEAFKENKWMGEADYAPFNEAMCAGGATKRVFEKEFIETRALGHRVSVEDYIKKVIEPLDKLFNKAYKCIVLWFGEDMFCQMNLLTLLAYLEQSGYDRKVFLNSFREDEFKVSQTEIKLGHYDSLYQEVLVNHRKPSSVRLPVMHQAIDIYLDMLNDDNAVVKYISKNKDVPTSELVARLFDLFPTIGYGDSQYIELINKIRGNNQ